MRLVDDSCWAVMTIWQEAQGETFAGKVAVAEVIRNRTKKKLMSDGTIPGTCLWPLQFSGWNAIDNSPSYRERIECAKLDTNDPVVQDCLRAWAEATAGSDTVRGATHYLNERVVLKVSGKLPDWVSKMTKVVTVGEHSFYRGGK